MKTWDAIYQEWQTDDGQIHAQRMGLLIRCKDCRHRSTTHFCSDEQEWCDFWRPLFGESHSTDLNKYCAWAERKEE